MSAFSDYFENALANWFRGTTFPAVPANVYVSLHTATLNDDGTGTEVSGFAYVRKAVATSTAQWDATSGTDGHTQNTNAITFVTATGSWGVITDFGIWDASTSGNLIVKGTLTASKTVGSGDTFQFNAGDLDITFA